MGGEWEIERDQETEGERVGGDGDGEDMGMVGLDREAIAAAKSFWDSADSLSSGHVGLGKSGGGFGQAIGHLRRVLRVYGSALRPSRADVKDRRGGGGRRPEWRRELDAMEKDEAERKEHGGKRQTEQRGLSPVVEAEKRVCLQVRACIWEAEKRVCRVLLDGECV